MTASDKDFQDIRETIASFTDVSTDAICLHAPTLQELYAPEAHAGALDPNSPLERIGVMMRRNDDRIDMPDLFRVAAKLLETGDMVHS